MVAIKRLSVTMEEALDIIKVKSKGGRWLSSAELGIRLNTLYALERRDLVESRREFSGAVCYDWKHILWRLKYGKNY